MRKSLYAFALLGMLGLGACSDDTFNPNVDFGDKTYINDYSSLVNAVNDLSKTLDERLAALNELIKGGLADVKVAINDNTKAIEAQTKVLNDSLGSLNNTLLNGFTALNEKIDSNGTKIVNAINKQGEVIQLQIKETGELIQGQIETSTSDIIKALGDNNAALTEKLGAINEALTTGLSDLKVAVNGIDSTLIVTNEKLGNIDASIQAQTEKIGTLASNVLEGFKNVTAKIDSTNANISKLIVSVDKNTTAVTNVSSSVADLQKSMEEQNGKLITAIDSLGHVIAISGSGSGSGSGSSCNVDFTELIAEIGTMSGHLTTLEQTIAKGDSSIVEALKEACKCNSDVAKNILFEEEDKNDDGTYNRVYVSPSIWNTETKNAIKGQLKAKAFTPTSRQAHCNFSTAAGLSKDSLYLRENWVGHAKFVQTEVSEEEVVVNSVIDKDGKQYFEAVKVNKYIVYKVRIVNKYNFAEDNVYCGFARIVGIYVKDAKGGDYQNGRWVYHWNDNNDTVGKGYCWFTNIKVNLYYDGTGVYLANPNINVYCMQYMNKDVPMNETEGDVDCSGK